MAGIMLVLAQGLQPDRRRISVKLAAPMEIGISETTPDQARRQYLHARRVHGLAAGLVKGRKPTRLPMPFASLPEQRRPFWSSERHFFEVQPDGRVFFRSAFQSDDGIIGHDIFVIMPGQQGDLVGISFDAIRRAGRGAVVWESGEGARLQAGNAEPQNTADTASE